MKWYEDKEYQLMCEKAGELQEKWGVRIFSQEDLQEMVKDREINIEYFSPSEESPSKDGRWCIMDCSTFYSHWFDMAVKLWLAFVMHELYQKKWNPETRKWEKTESQ